MSVMLRKWGLIAGAVVVSFAAGRFTMKSSVEKKVETRYEKKYTEMLSQVETRFSDRLKESVETIKKEVETASERENDVDEKIVIGADGSHNITRKIRSREKSKTNTVIKTEIKVVEVEKIVEKIVVQEKIVVEEREVVRTVEKVIPPPSWRVYGIASVRSPTDERDVAYGAGTQYDLGPVNVGGYGTYSIDSKDATLGVTLGVSF